MSSILELREARERAARWSVEDYEQYGEMLADNGVLPKRAELIRGIIIEKTPKSILHVELTEIIRDEFLRQLPSGYRVMQEGPLRLSDSEPEPDVSIVVGSLSTVRGQRPTTAVLVVEVAVTSIAMDREYALMYAEAMIQEYWIVVAERREVEVHRQPADGVYQTTRIYRADETITCEALPEISLSLKDLFG